MLRTARQHIESTLPCGGTPSQRGIDRLLTLNRAVLRGYSLEDRRTLEAALMFAHVLTDNLDTALEIAAWTEASWPDPNEHEISTETLVAFCAAQTEVYLASGNVHSALKWSTRVLQYVAESGNPQWHYRSHGLAAISTLLNGEIAECQKHLEQGEQIIRREGWNPQVITYLHATANALNSYLRSDDEAIARLVPRIRLLASRQPVADSLATLCEAIHLELLGETYPAMTLYAKVYESVAGPLGPRLIRDFARHFYAFQLLRQWESTRAINWMDDQITPENHVLCPHVVRGIGKLQMGDYAGVLAETSPCVKPTLKHSRWIFPPILMIRAIAFLKTGHEDQAFQTAMLLRNDAESLKRYFETTMGMFPRAELRELLDFVESRSPWALYRVSKQRIAKLTREHPNPVSVQALTERERPVALQLNSELSLVQIAQKLFVSHGTVTAQASSVYRKLGVHNRVEAVNYLEGIGFFEGSATQ